MHTEFQEHITKKHWKIVQQKHVPEFKYCIHMVWSTKIKCNHIGEVVKLKARLCAGGHKSTKFVDYWDTYSLVVSWKTIRLIFTLTIVNDWHIRSIDFFSPFHKGKSKLIYIYIYIYIDPPTGPHNFCIPYLPRVFDRLQNVYNFLKNLYRLKDGGRTWNAHLEKGLLARGWM